MKNRLFVVYGGNCEESDEGFVSFTNGLTDPIPFKNKEKADNYKETLLDGFMKTKSYSQNYEITEEDEIVGAPVKTKFVEILNKRNRSVYRVEILEVDLDKIVL